LLERVDKFLSGKEPIPPIAIVGAYGSGKSELLYEGFRYVWREAKRVAFFVKLEDLLKLLPKELSPDELYDEILQLLQNQLFSMRDAFNGGSSSKLFLPELKEDQTIEDYFRELKISIDYVREAIQHDEIVLFIDEMEQHYKELRDRLRTSDMSPLRAFLEKVEHRKGSTPFFLVMGFALGSAYETLGGAEARRRHSIHIPLPSPEEFGILSERYRNLLWWCSRGRPGWAIKIRDDHVDTFDRTETVYDEKMRRFFDDRIDGLPYLSSAGWDHLVTSTTSRALKRLLLELRPVAKSELACPLLDLLDAFNDRVMVSDELTPSTKILDSIFMDLRRIADGQEFKSYNPDLLLIRDYLSRILTAISNQNGEIVFGAWTMEEAFAKNIIVPLLIILHDLILEFEGYTEKGEASWKFIQGILTDIGATSTELSVWKTINRFRETKKHFKTFYNEEQVAYIQPSLKFVEELFPRLIVRPLLTLSDMVEKELDRQRIRLEAAVETGGGFLEQSISVDDFKVRFIFLPSLACIYRLQEEYFTTMHRNNYLPYDQIYIIASLSGEKELNLDYTRNHEISILEELGKVKLIPIPERQLADFIVSLWRNLTVMREESRELLRILETLQNDTNMSKHAKRTLQYYADLLDDILNDIARKQTKEYRAKMSKVIPIKSKDFPEDSISEIAGKIRENRTVECIAVAFDLAQDLGKAAMPLATLREMKEVGERVKGYSEFFIKYTVVERDSPRPSGAIEPIVKYIKDYGFGKLTDYAKNLYPTLSSIDWKTLTEDLDNSPLEVMFGWSKESRYFLRAVYLRAFLELNRSTLMEEVSKTLDKAEDTLRRLDKLRNEINDFNSKLQKLDPRLAQQPLLSTSRINILVDELGKFSRVQVDKLPSATLYVVHKFADAAVDEIEKMRQKWAGQAGIKAWKNMFDNILTLEETLYGYKQQVDNYYATNRVSKEAIIGKIEEIYEKKVKEPLVSAARNVLDSLETTFDLTSDNTKENSPPSLNYDAFNKARESVNNFINEVAYIAGKIDNVADLAKSIRDKIEKVYSVMVN
jgi:hypothetical protein